MCKCKRAISRLKIEVHILATIGPLWKMNAHAMAPSPGAGHTIVKGHKHTMSWCTSTVEPASATVTV